MKKTFLAGLATLLPVAVTLALVLFLVNFMTKPFMGFVTQLVSHRIHEEHLIRYLSQVLILISLFLVTWGLGALARWFFIRAFLKAGESLLHRIPIVNKVYKTSKEIIHSLFGAGATSFQQVVMVPFPYPGCYCLGLVTNEMPKKANEALGEDVVSVFILTAPNPTAGYLVVQKKSNLIYLDMKSEDAAKYVISFGVIQPSC